MSAYGTLDAAIAGMSQGLSKKVYGKVSGETDGIGFGKPVFSYEGVDNLVYLYHKNKATLTLNKALVSEDTITLTIDGTELDAITFDSDMPTTGALIIAAIQAAFPTAIVACTDNAANGNTWLIYTIEIQDDGDRVATGVCTGGGGTPATVTPTYSSTQKFMGFALFTQKEAAIKKDLEGNTLVAASALYKLADPVNVLYNGLIWTGTDSAVDAQTAVYCVVSGTYKGWVTSTVGSNLALTGVEFRSTVAAAGLALVRVNL